MFRVLKALKSHALSVRVTQTNIISILCCFSEVPSNKLYKITQLLRARPFSIMLAFFGIVWENEHFFSFSLEKELLAFSVIFHDYDTHFGTQKDK